jgi:CHAT domain-containing protein
MLLVVAALAGCSSRPDAMRRELAVALGPVRPVEGRLVGGFLYRPFEAGRVTNLTSAGRTALSALDAMPEVRPLLDLFRRRAASAVERLEHLVDERPGDAGLWSDLAAAYLARAVEPPATPLDFARALEASLHALEIDSKLAEARFNAALAFERLGLRREARESWNELLQMDPSSGWADEAEIRLQRLGRPVGLQAWRHDREDLLAAAKARDEERTRGLVREFSQPIRRLIEDELIPEWGKGFLAGNQSEAVEKLTIARFLAAQLAEVSGDRMAQDAVATIDAAESGPDSKRVTALARGHLAYGTAIPILTRHELDHACPLLASSRRDLEHSGSPFAGWAIAGLIACTGERQEFQSARREAFDLLHHLDASRYPALAGRLSWSAGIALLGGGDPDAALAVERPALAAFERLGERENAAQSRTILAESLRYLGADDEAWFLHVEALGAQPWLTPRPRACVLEEAAQALTEEKLHRAALALREEELRAVERQGDATSRAASYQVLAESRLALGRRREAEADLATASRWADRIEDTRLRERVQADLAVVGSRIAPDEPQRAVAHLTQALNLNLGRDNRYPLVPLYLARGRAYRNAGELPRALHDFRAGIAVAEEVRSQLAEDPLRVSYLAQAPELFDEAISALDRLGRHREALETAERARARGLFDRLSTAGRSETILLPAEQIAAALPDDLALVEFASLQDRLLIWVMERDGIRSFSIPVGRTTLSSTLDAFERALARGDCAALDRAAETLHGTLIAPIERALGDRKRIVFLPDSTLQRVSFAALRDARTGRYLVEDWATGVAPSANVFLRCLNRLRELGAAPPRDYLLVGEPHLDPQIFPKARPLPEARREIENISLLYPKATVLVGRDATREAIRTALSHADGFQFAGHSFLNLRYPLLSRLALAPDRGHSGSLYAREIDDLPLSRLRLVILSSCSSAAGPTAGGEGALSLARPFLAAGVPQMIAAPRDVEDRVGAALVVALHRHLAQGIEPLDALRAAQLDLLHARDSRLSSPAAWSSFEVIGGS